MLKEFEDFKLLLSLGFKGEEIINLSFTPEERNLSPIQAFLKNMSTEVDHNKKDQG